MSKSLSAFMRPNVAEIKNASFAPSPRFVGEDGKPVEWESAASPPMSMPKSAPPASGRSP